MAKRRTPPDPPTVPVVTYSTSADPPAALAADGTTVALYRGSLAKFLDDVDANTLVPTLTARFLELEGRAPSEGEVTAWRRSLPAMADVLRAPAFALAHLFVELRMPLNGRRCDVLLTGRAVDGTPSADNYMPPGSAG